MDHLANLTLHRCSECCLVEQDCPGFSFGILCKKPVSLFQSHLRQCLEQSDNSICSGLVHAASVDYSSLCQQNEDAACRHWMKVKALVSTVWEVEIADILVDLIGIVSSAGLVALTRGLRTRDASRLSKLEHNTRCLAWICALVAFIIDIILEITVAVSMASALTTVTDVKESHCFTAGDGFATLVKLEANANTIATFAGINVVIAVAFGMLDLRQARRDWQDPASRPQELINLARASLLGGVMEILLGIINFFANTEGFIGELQAIEQAALGVKQLESGHVCYMRHPDLPMTSPTGVGWNQPWLNFATPIIVASLLFTPLPYFLWRVWREPVDSTSSMTARNA